MSHRARTFFLIGLGIILLTLFCVLAFSISTKIFLFERIDSFDAQVQSLVRDNATIPGAQMMYFFTNLANQEVVIISLVSLFILLFLFRERTLAVLFVGGFALSVFLSTYLKILLLRVRPTSEIFSITQGGYAFPSGHSILAVMFYGFLGYVLVHSAHKQWQKILITSVSGIVIFLIGLSRIYLGVHWASDVVGGWLVGAIILIILIFIFRHFHKNDDITIQLTWGWKLALAIAIVVAVAGAISYFYVTQASELRSIMDSVPIQ